MALALPGYGAVSYPTGEDNARVVKAQRTLKTRRTAQGCIEQDFARLGANLSLDLQCSGTGTVIARRQSRRGDPVQFAVYACIFCFWIASAFGLAMTEQALSWRLHG